MFCLDWLLDFLKPIQDAARDYLLRHLLHIIQVGQNVEALTREAGILEDKKKDVKEKIQRDETALKEPTNEVSGWLERVEDIQSKVRSIKADYESRSCMFFNCCSCNCYSNHSISERALEELQNVKNEMELIHGVTEFTVEPVPQPAQQVQMNPLKAAGGEIESKFKMALEFLNDGSKGILGIWGMGGVGKTTLLKHINNSLAEDPKSFRFDRVVLVTAAGSCTVQKLQELIARELRLPESGNHYNDISIYLKGKSFLILIDDLWESLDLEAVGIPLPLGVAGPLNRKLILASRSEHVCYKMGAVQTIKVHCLSSEAARLLFRETVGTQTISSDPQLLKLVDEVADECNGLPLALVAIGKSMAGVTNAQVWESALSDLQASKTQEVTDTADDFLPILKISYDYLRDEKKQECLLLCALWPEDHKILKDDLIQCWMGHSLLGDFEDIQKAYNKGHAIIDSLQKASLLELEHVEPGTYDEVELVRLHDLVRDMALWIACDCGKNQKKWMALAGLKLQEAPRDLKPWSEAHKISLAYNNIEVLPSKAKNNSSLVTLMLQSNRSLQRSGIKILKCFSLLKYLDLARCGLGGAIRAEICELVMLEFLNLSFNQITAVPEKLQSLTRMKYLLLRGNNIPNLPNGLFADMSNLLQLDLLYNGLGDSSCLILNHLDSLEGCLPALGIDANPHGLQQLGRRSCIPIRSLKLMNIEQSSFELLSLNCLGRQHAHSYLKDLAIAHSHFKVLEIDQEHCFSSLQDLSLFDLDNMKDIIWKGVCPGDIFPKVCRIKIHICPLTEHFTWVVHLPCLKILEVLGCHSVKQIVDWKEIAKIGGQGSAAFQSLCSLYLYDLPEMRSICDGELCFPSLEYMFIFRCKQFKRFPLASLASCTKLKSIGGPGVTQWFDSLDLGDDMKNLYRHLLEDVKF